MTDPRPGGDVAASGDLLVADGARLEGNFRCEGNARLGRGAVVDGTLEVAGALVVREKAAVTGAVACAGDVEWHPLATAASLRCDGAFLLGEHPLATSIEVAEGIAPWTPKEGSS